MPRAHQIHFEVSPKYNRFIKKYAKKDHVSLSEYYRRSAFDQAKRESFIDKAQRFDQKLTNDNSPIINSRKDFAKWLRR